MNDPQPYEGPERRVVSRHEIADMVAEEIAVQLDKTEGNLIHHFNVKMGQFELSMTSKMTEIVNEAFDKHIEEAFPPGPLHKHKDQHQKHIDAAANTKRIVQDLQLWAVRGIITILAVLVGLGAKDWVIRELAK